MAKKTKDPEPASPAEVTPQQGIDLLERQIAKGEEFLAKKSVPENDYSSWELLTKNFLEKAFGKGSPNVTSITSVGKYGAFPMNASPAWWENHRAESLAKQLTKMRGLVDLLKTETELQNVGVVKSEAVSAGHRIFLVHGHDELVLQETARFLEKLDQEVIILREQPNRGRTIIEKFEDYANVGFAVVLLTGDDRGGTAATLLTRRSHGPDRTSYLKWATSSDASDGTGSPPFFVRASRFPRTTRVFCTRNSMSEEHGALNSHVN